MGHNAQVKLLRKQIRNVTKEEFPNVMNNELFIELQKQVFAKVEKIAEAINKRLDDVDSKQRDFQNYVIRQLTVPQSAAKVEDAKKN